MVVVDGTTPANDPDFHITLFAGLPYVITFTGNHSFYEGEQAYWTAQGTDCPATSSSVWGALDASLSYTATLLAGDYELCLVQTTPSTKHDHITATVFNLPPSPPPPSPPPTPPPPRNPPPSLPPTSPGATYQPYTEFTLDIGGASRRRAQETAQASNRTAALDDATVRLIIEIIREFLFLFTEDVFKTTVVGTQVHIIVVAPCEEIIDLLVPIMGEISDRIMQATGHTVVVHSPPACSALVAMPHPAPPHSPPPPFPPWSPPSPLAPPSPPGSPPSVPPATYMLISTITWFDDAVVGMLAFTVKSAVSNAATNGLNSSVASVALTQTSMVVVSQDWRIGEQWISADSLAVALHLAACPNASDCTVTEGSRRRLLPFLSARPSLRRLQSRSTSFLIVYPLDDGDTIVAPSVDSSTLSTELGSVASSLNVGAPVVATVDATLTLTAAGTADDAAAAAASELSPASLSAAIATNLGVSSSAMSATNARGVLPPLPPPTLPPPSPSPPPPRPPPSPPPPIPSSLLQLPSTPPAPSAAVPPYTPSETSSQVAQALSVSGGSGSAGMVIGVVVGAVGVAACALLAFILLDRRRVRLGKAPVSPSLSRAATSFRSQLPSLPTVRGVPAFFRGQGVGLGRHGRLTMRKQKMVVAEVTPSKSGSRPCSTRTCNAMAAEEGIGRALEVT